jgi:hypothetical protein
MEAARTIRDNVARVSQLRKVQAQQPALRGAMHTIKSLQARRFAITYADLLGPGPYQAAASFFLGELYGERDFSARDDQFARIAGAIERFFPAAVVQTAVSLSQLHALTEDLDHGMAVEWIAQPDALPVAGRYLQAWRSVRRRPERQAQLEDLLAIGEEMSNLTRKPGLRTMLRMMRGPAVAAGLAALQRFLETGFDTFAGMARGGHAPEFLRIIGTRESAWIALLFDTPPVACETEVERALGQAP